MKRIALALTVFCLLLQFLVPLNINAQPALKFPEKEAKYEAERILVKFKSGITLLKEIEAHNKNGGQFKKNIPALGVQLISVPKGRALEKVKSYIDDPSVEYAEPDYQCQVVETPNDTYLSSQWAVTKIQAPLAWDITAGNGNTKIAILDTGIDLDHPDLAGKITVSVNFSDSTTVDDVYGHGTHVAGIAAAGTNNGIGVAGIARNASLMNVKVMGDGGSGSYSWIASGIIWAADNGANVINLSLGSPQASFTLQNAVNYAWSKGVVVVAASGNSGSATPIYPAACANAIAVAATDSNDALPTWSSYGDWVDLAAPGSSIFSTIIGNSYGYKSGTSMASPHAAGLAALLCTLVTDDNNDGRINDDVCARMESSCDVIGVTGIGHGRINAAKAVGYAPVLPGCLTGNVKNAANGTAISGAVVSEGTRTATTDTLGNYSIADVPPGTYQLTCKKEGYNDSSSSSTVIPAQPTTSNFSLTPKPMPVKTMWVNSIKFAQSGKNMSIEVRVFNARGVVPGAKVGMLLKASTGKEWTFSGSTNLLGCAVFKTERLPAGSYSATVTNIVCPGFSWDASRGVTSAVYILK